MDMRHTLLILVPALLLMAGCKGGGLNGFKAAEPDPTPAVENDFSFNGYTNHWQNYYRRSYKYGNLYRLNVPDVGKALAQSKLDLAQALGLPGLRMQEGFFNGLATSDFVFSDNPDEDMIRGAFNQHEAVLVLVDRSSDMGKELVTKDPLETVDIGSYQTREAGFTTLDAFVLAKGDSKLFVVLGEGNDLKQFKGILDRSLQVARDYDLKRGWFGAETNIRSVTCLPGNPLDIMGIGVNEGNSWFVFSGLYEFLLGDSLRQWVADAGCPVVTDLGSNPIYGCDDWEGLQVQEMRSSADWSAYQQKKHGYIFRPIPWEGPASGEPCDGYFATVSNQEQVNQWDKPFVIRTGNSLEGLTNSMVLFIGKGKDFDRAAMWDTIMSRRSVCVAEEGIIMGPDLFRQAMQLMVLDRVWLEDCFGDRVNITSSVKDHVLKIELTNLYPHEVKGDLELMLPDHVTAKGGDSYPVKLAAGASKVLEIELEPTAVTMGRMNAVAARFDWGSSSKLALASYDMPPAVSTHQLFYGPASGFVFPVSIHNFTSEGSVPVKVTVYPVDNPEKAAYRKEKTCEIGKGGHTVVDFDIKLAPGAYIAKAEAMGISAQTQIGVSREEGEVTLKEVDLNGDGVNEYVMENDKVRVSLLRTGGRVIEYYLKSKDDNIFFKLWPGKPVDEARPNRKWGFYPYGGFEDFLGQASVETHKVYDAEVVKAGGSYAEVKMRADYYGSVIEKTFSLYGNSPLLGLRYSLDMVHPEMNVLGPQPIIEIGKTHGTEDKFIIPELDGIHSYVMDPVNMYGKILYLREGWNAAYDTRENISFVGAYPVDRPYYLHMWMNLSTNGESHYPYTELQPWLPLYYGNTSYFSYYMWTEGTTWEKGLKELRDRNLITQTNK